MNAAIVPALLSGLTTSVGPCVAPRYLAVAAAVSNQTIGQRARSIAAFAVGTIAGYAAIATGGATLALVFRHSSVIEMLIATLLVISALFALRHPGGKRCVHGPRASTGSLALLGLSSSVAISPCCMPAVMAFGVLVAQGSPGDALACMGAFFAGHLAPIALALVRLPLPANNGVTEWAATVRAGIMLSLGALYGLLA